ncbi:hypothetical protein SK069_06645 [Patulibacter brassicae]|jgi:hypothetical protein|uniref:DUF4267 domain-containing protein n=1 Tax=Patulibacter brassicae TaxID=1705717 RepID=A0ABU4VJZ7_9ACTN|nr:hypothetical protein [Patulibacter brassicae]MDX8151261.1 hypothetical protein [Patulibacter brassicae]
MPRAATLPQPTRGGPADLRPVERVLGWASIGLGVPQTLAPAAFARAIGAPDGPRSRVITRLLCGPRELAVGAGILAGERPRPARTLRARVAGDALDAALLALAWRTGPRHRGRLAVATVATAAIGATDLLAARRAGTVGA